MSKFRPLHDRVLLRRLSAEEKTAGGIIIPATAQEKPAEAEVVAVGSGARDEQGQIVALEVKPGDKVLFGKWSGTEVKIDGARLVREVASKTNDIVGDGTMTATVLAQAIVCEGAKDVAARVSVSVATAPRSAGRRRPAAGAESI